MQSTEKNGVATLAHTHGVAQLVSEAEVDQRVHHFEKFLQAVCLYCPENFSSSVAKTYHHDVAPSEQAFGFIRKGGQYLLIVGERAFALDELREHGVFSEMDMGEFVYLGKFLASLIRDAAAGKQMAD